MASAPVSNGTIRNNQKVLAKKLWDARARQSGPRWPKSPPLMMSLTENPQHQAKIFFSSAIY